MTSGDWPLSTQARLREARRAVLEADIPERDRGGIARFPDAVSGVMGVPKRDVHSGSAAAESFAPAFAKGYCVTVTGKTNGLP